jgi:hypothetical protein
MYYNWNHFALPRDDLNKIKPNSCTNEAKMKQWIKRKCQKPEKQQIRRGKGKAMKREENWRSFLTSQLSRLSLPPSITYLQVIKIIIITIIIIIVIIIIIIIIIHRPEIQRCNLSEGLHVKNSLRMVNTVLVVVGCLC